MIHSRTLHALEFPQITEHLAGLCLSPAGRERALELRPLEDAAAVTHAARLYDESAVWAARPMGEGGFALGSFPDVGAFLRVAEKPGLQPDTDAFWALREMLRLAKAILTQYTWLNADLLLAGVILHDLCKTEEMDSNDMGVVRDYSREGLLLGHLVLGVNRIQEAANKLGISGEPVLLLQHMMLSHHGEAEFGSPRKPMFPEAEALHWVDLLDARMNEMQTAIQKLKPGVFSEKIWSLDRRLYRADYDALEQDGTKAEPETEG